jgi:hypothetical protein
MLGVFILASSAFIAFGSVIASLTQKPEVASYFFLMIFLTIFFLGCFPEESLPDIIQKIIPWLPTKMAIELKRGVVNVFKIRDSWIYWAYTRIGL